MLERFNEVSADRQARCSHSVRIIAGEDWTRCCPPGLVHVRSAANLCQSASMPYGATSEPMAELTML